MQAFLTRYYQPIFLSLMAVLLVVVFYAGYLEGKTTTSQPVVLACKQNVLDKLSIPTEAIGQGTASDTVTTGQYVGSKNGTKYYSPDCSGAQRIKPDNYIWFQSAQDAQIQGYTPGSC